MRRAFTLVELLVVLVLMGLALGIAAPALRAPQAEAEPPIAPLLRAGRMAAIARGEPTTLHVNPTGAWHVEGRGNAAGGPLAAGNISPAPGAAFSIVFSTLGTCAMDIRSHAAASAMLDPLTCELRSP